MPLGTEVGLGPVDIVLDGNTHPGHHHHPGKGHSSPTFRPMSVLAKRPLISATAELYHSSMLVANYIQNSHKPKRPRPKRPQIRPKRLQ